ncbi:hypothetical protein HA402_002958 [Bradysia odoriphaga]|nr:hypothetical protein HA402_002958 [Bradysia odoriphaga]
MATIHQRLKHKSSNAKIYEYFVFLPNNLTDISSISSNDNDPKFRDAVAAKNTGNACFENDQYEDAILHYNKAIDILEGMDSKSCAVLLGVCYQNRATAHASQKNFAEAISDASKAVELNEHYSKAYYRRAMCYYVQKRYYRALQDIMQACVLERFRNKLYINTAVEIVAEIDKDPETIQWRKAYDEMDAASLFCDLCLNRHMRFVKNCGVFEPISVPVPDNPKSQPWTGFIRAMVGIKNLNIPEIMAGCDEEIVSKGKYLAQSYILQAYMSSVVIQSPATVNDDLQRDMQRMNDIISDVTIPETVKDQAKFCRANLNNRNGRFIEADRDLKSLEDQYGNTGLFNVIKSCALFQFALRDESFFKSLEKCAKILPDVYELQFQLIRAKSNYISDELASLAFMMRSLENLIKRFPLELTPKILLIGFYIELDVNKASRMLRQVRKDFPNRLGEMISLYGQLQPTHPSCVGYYKQAIRAHKDDPNSFEGLLEYFDTTTFEYAKAIEVCTKAMFNFLKKDDFKIMFERRQQLLKKIIHYKFWDKL